jgi:hypothetical protein
MPFVPPLAPTGYWSKVLLYCILALILVMVAIPAVLTLAGCRCGATIAVIAARATTATAPTDGPKSSNVKKGSSGSRSASRSHSLRHQAAHKVKSTLSTAPLVSSSALMRASILKRDSVIMSGGMPPVREASSFRRGPLIHRADLAKVEDGDGEGEGQPPKVQMTAASPIMVATTNVSKSSDQQGPARGSKISIGSQQQQQQVPTGGSKISIDSRSIRLESSIMSQTSIATVSPRGKQTTGSAGGGGGGGHKAKMSPGPKVERQMSTMSNALGSKSSSGSRSRASKQKKKYTSGHYY